MTKQLLLTLGAGLILASASMAQRRPCGTMENLASEIAADPARGQRLQEIEQMTQHYLAAHPDGNRGGGVVVIPVIWHVLYNTPDQNIPTAQIQAAMSQLNDDFARLNSDASNTPAAFQTLASSVNVQFCLAQQDPNGNPTNGIQRRTTFRTEFPFTMPFRWEKFAYSGGDNAWPRDKYLNIWTCNMTGFADGIGTFPGGPANADGITMLFGDIGSIANPGPAGNPRTLTHEAGHWLNLRHIWGDALCGDDLVNDTPTQNQTQFNCPTWPVIDCSSGPDGVMFCNYMDYTDEACINMFSIGQAARMNALFAPGGARAPLITSIGCTPVTPACPSIALVSTPGSTFSCGATGKVVGASGNNGKIWAQTASRIFNQSPVYANLYKFEFANPGAGYLRTITSTSSALVLAKWATNPLLCGTFVYNVRVQASFDGGATYCPYGPVCSVTITNNFAQPFCTSAPSGSAQNAVRSMMQADDLFSMWPNPNNGDELFLSINGMDENATSMSVDMFDIFGKRVMTSTIPSVGGKINTTITLNADLASGLYFVNVTCAGEVRSERLMIQR